MRRGRTQMRLQTGSVDHIDRHLEQAGNVLLKPDVIEDSILRAGLEFYEDVEITVRAILAAGHGTEHRGMQHPRARRALSWRRRVAMALSEFIANI